MAVSGKRIDAHTVRLIHKRLESGGTLYSIAQYLDLNWRTVKKYRDALLTNSGKPQSSSREVE